MNIRDVVYETARQFSEIAAAQYWIQQRVGDINTAATEIREALQDQRKWFIEALGIAQEMRERKRMEKAEKRKLQSKKRKKTVKKRNVTVKKRKAQTKVKP